MFRNYLKMAWKVLGRRKFFTFVSLFGIGFTLMAIILVVAVADHNLSASYPELELDRILVLKRMQMRGERSRWTSGPGYRTIDRYGRDIPGVERMTVFSSSSEASSFLEGRKLEFKVLRTDAEFWRVLQFNFQEGAAFTTSDDDHANRVAVISESTRKRFFGDESAVGKSVELDGLQYRVIGVVQDVPYHRQIANADIWVPLRTHPAIDFFDREIGGSVAAYLLEEGADVKQVQAAFRERLTRVEFDRPDRYDTMEGYPMTSLENLSNNMLSLEPGQTAPRSLVLYTIGFILLFMALPAINLVNINLSRIYERHSEIGVRKAFGAAGTDLVLQFVTENVVLSVIGGLLGLAGAWICFQIAPLFPDIPPLSFKLNWTLIGSTLLAATFFGLLSGVWPAWKMSRQHPVVALRGGTS